MLQWIWTFSTPLGFNSSLDSSNKVLRLVRIKIYFDVDATVYYPPLSNPKQHNAEMSPPIMRLYAIAVALANVSFAMTGVGNSEGGPALDQMAFIQDLISRDFASFQEVQQILSQMQDLFNFARHS